MKTRTLGKSNTQISSIGYGCMGSTEFYGKSLPKNDAVNLIKTAYDEHGITFFDTADMYGKGLSEEILGEAISSFRERVIVATKCGILREDTGEIGNFSPRMRVVSTPAYIKQACDLSLKRLNVDSIDLYYLHRHNPDTSIEESMMAMLDLVSDGKIKGVGLSEVNAETLRRAHAVLGDKLVALQTEYSFFIRTPAQSVLSTCHELQVSFVAYSPITRGLLGSKSRKAFEFDSSKGIYDYRVDVPLFQDNNIERNLYAVNKLSEIAHAKNCTTAQLSLAWLLAQENVIPIPGTSNQFHLKENADAQKIRLSTEEINLLEKIYLNYPLVGERA